MENFLRTGVPMSQSEIDSLERDCRLIESEIQMRQANGFRFLDDDTSPEIRIFLSGYDTSLPKDTVKDALCEHVSSCGKIIDLRVSRDCPNGVLHEIGLVSVMGEGAWEKAQKLKNGGPCGCDVKKGCKLVVDHLFSVPREEPLFCFDLEALEFQAAEIKKAAEKEKEKE